MSDKIPYLHSTFHITDLFSHFKVLTYKCSHGSTKILEKMMTQNKSMFIHGNKLTNKNSFTIVFTESHGEQRVP